MEEDKLELKCLKEGIEYLDKAVKCFAECDTVTKEEYKKIANYLDDLENRKIELEIEINGCILEEV